MADWWEKYKKDRNLGGNKKSSSKRTWLKKEVSVTDENRQTAKSSTWWEDYKKTRDLDSKVAANRQRAERSQRFGSANRQLEENRSRDAAEDEIRELFRNPFSSDAEWQAGVLQRNAERYKRDLPLYQQAMQNSSTWGEYFSAHRQAGESQSAVKHQFERYQQATQKAEQERNESNLVNRPALYASEHMTPEQISAELDRLRSGAATPTVTDKDRNDPVYAYLYPEAALQKVPHGARFDERLLEGAGQDAIDALYRPILTEQEKAAVEEADRKIIEDKANRNYERVQILKAAQSMQTERTSRETGNKLMEEIATGGAAAKQVESGRAAFEAKQQQIASETSFEIGDDLDSNRGAYNKMQKERRERGYILGYDWDNVPEARKQAVYALYAQDPEKAIELAKFYISDVRQAEDEERQAWYAQSGWTAALGLVSSAAAHLGAAVDPFGDVGQELTRRGDNALAGGSQWADAATGYQKIPEWVPIVGGKGAGDLYQTVGSVVQSAAVAAPAILAGRYDQAAAEIVGKLGLVLMGSSAAASDYRESVAAGMDEDRAKLHALAAGVEEALFEEVSLDKLIKMDTSGGLKSALKNWLVQSGIEGSEELATSIANRITDEMISGAGQSKVERRASELIANGMSAAQAHTQAENEWMTDTLYEGFSGFLSGGMMTGGNYALQGLANLKERAVNAAETRKVQKQAGAAVSRSEGSVEAIQAYAKDKGIEIKDVETADQNAEHGEQGATKNSYSSRDYRSISDTNSKVTQSIRNEVRGKTVQEQQTIRDNLVEKYGEGIAPAVYNAISLETASRVRQEYGDVDSIQAARNQAVSEIKDESLRRAVSDGYDSAAYSLAASQGGEGGMNTMSRYIQQRNNTGTGEMSMNATVTAQDGSTKTISITGMSEDGKRVSLADGSEVAVKDMQADADTTSAIQQLADLDLGADATKVLQAYQQSGVSGTEGYRWLMDYATAYNQGRTRQISLEQAAQRSSLDERTVMDAYTLGQQAANRETLAGLEKLKNLPKRKGASGRTANIDTTEIKGKTMSKSELEQFALANQYAQALGVDMTWFSSKEQDGKFIGKNGAYENGKIYMDIHAGRNFAADLTSGILATMGHELSHFEQQYAPEEYQALKEFLFEQIVKSSPNGEARLERLIWEKQRRSGNTLSRKAAEDEVVADACQKMLRDSKAVHDFASQQPEAANGVVRWLDKWFKRVRSIFGRGGNYSEEAQLMDSLEQDVKAAFGELWDKALKQAAKVHDEVGDIEGNADQYSLRDVDPVEPSSDAWSRSATFAEVKAKHPTLFALDADESDTRNPTQRKVTVSTYRKIYNMLKEEGFNGTILDASSGLGLGTETGRKEFGFDVDDIEPFPDKSYKPMYTDYSTLDKTYDVVISNAVLNVIPQDLRDAMVVKIGEMLKPGGRAFINVRGDDVLNAGSKVAINEDGMEYFISDTGSYQKGFTRNELKAYLEDALGDGFTVKIRKDFGKVSAEVIRDGSKAQNSDRDAEYLELAKDPEKNAAKLQEMVDEAAKRTGASEQMAEEAVVQNSDRLDDETLCFLDNQEHVTVYRAMQMIDGKLYPPMAAKVEGKLVDATELGEWYQAVERPDLINPKTGKWKLDKANGKAIKAAYNPYFHTSATPLNDQFSSAYKRPNIVVVEGIIPKSELTSGYKAQYAKDSVGETKWHAGPVASKLKGAKSRRVFLSRWFQAQRVVSDAEVADVVAKTLEGENIAVPNNVVTPSLLEALRERGVAIDEDAIDRFESKHGIRQNSDRDTEYLDLAKDPEKNAAKLQEMVDEAAKRTGFAIKAYHGTGSEFNSFDLQRSGSNSKELVGDSAEGMFFFSSIREAYPGSAQDYARIAGKKTGQEVIRDVYLKMENPLDLDSKGWYATADYYDNNRDSIYDQYLSGDYDGIIIRDSSGGDDNTIYLLDDANRIKSADPVTYDDSGNVIPLSERFNEANEDIRYSERPATDSTGRELSEGQQEYFKDSKIRDKYGNLLTLYHGTASDFTVFDLGRSGKNYDGWSEYGIGIYLTPDKKFATYFSESASQRGGTPKLMELYANIKNPFNANDPVTVDVSEYAKKYKLTEDDVKFLKKSGDRWLAFMREHNEDIYDFLTSHGYDGLWDAYGTHAPTQIVAFTENQVKNADNLNPTDNPDIRYSERDYSTPSDEELLMNARVEDAESPETRAALQNSQKQARQIRDLTRRLEHLQTEIRGYEGDSPNRISVQRFTRQALDLFGIPSGMRTDMGELLQSVAEGVLAGHNLSQNDIMYFFETLITNGREKTVADETLAEIRDDLKGRKIYVNENVKAEFGDDWNAFRKRAFSLGIQLTNNEKNMGIDTVNAELAELYPGKFDANETDLRSILENIVDTAESGKTSDVPILDAMREIQKQTGEPVREQLQTMLDQFTRQIEIMQDQAAVERKARAGNAAEIAKTRKQINEAKEALIEVRKQRNAWKRKSEGADARQKRALDAALRGIVQHDAKQIAEAVRQKQALAKKLQDQIDREKKILSGELRSPELVKMLKAEREKAEAQVKKQKEQVFQNYKERKAATDLRGRIKNLSDEMKRRMTNPTDRAYVPASLYQSMTKLADVLDNVLSPNPGTKAEARYRAMMDAIRGMAREYEDVKNLDPVFASEYEQEISDAIGEIERILERKNASWIDNLTGDTQKGLAELNSDELQQLYDLMRQINYTITNATKVFGNSNYKSIFDAQRAVAEQQNSMKSLNAVSRLERKKRLRLLNSLSVMRATEMMAGWDRSAALYQLMHGIEQGSDAAWAWVMDYNKSMQDLKTGKNEKEYRQALTKQLDFGITDRDGLKVTMTKMQALQILMTAEREEHNDKLLHLQAGGAVIRNAIDLQNGKGAKARSQTISVTPELIQKIRDSLTEWDKAYMKTVRDYFKREGKRTNEILYKLKHKVLKTEEFYVPYTVDRNYLEANLNEQQALNMWVKTPGSTNALKQKAKQPVIIDGMDTVMGQHVKEIGNYIGMAIPIRDFSKVYNGMIPTEGPNPLPVKETIERTFGKAGQHLLTQAVIDVQGGTARQNWESNIAQFLNKLQGAFVKSALLINPSVTIKQAASYIAAESVISHLALERGNHSVWARTDESKSFMPGGLIAQLFARPEGKTAQRIYNEIDQYTSLHYQRRQGMSMAEIAEQANRTGPIKRRINAIGASMEQSKIGHVARRTGENLNPLTWIQRMDVATTAALWVACKEQAKLDKLAVGSEEFWKRTTELYERCIRETQPMYDGLHRTANQKQAGGLMQYLFPFRTVPIQNHGQLSASYEAYKAARESKNEAKIKEAGKFFRKTVWAQTESAFVFSVMTFLAAILKRKTKKYRDEEGEFDAGSFTKGLLTDVGSTLISVLNPMYGSELFNLGSRAVDKFEGNSGYTYDAFSVGVVDMINDLASSGDRLLADAGKIVRGENVNAADFWNHAMNLLVKGGKLAGIPADTVKTYFEGTKGNIQDAIEGRIPALNDESWERDAATNARRYLKAYLDNDTKKANAVLAELRSNLSKSGKDEGKINEAIRKYVSAQAVEKVADGTWTEEEAEAYLLSTGAYDDRENPQKDAWNAIRKGVAKATSTDEEFNWKQYDELAEAVANGEDVTDILTEYRNHGYSDDQINGAIKSGIQEALTSGDLDGNEAADALIRYGVTYSKDGKTVAYDEQTAWKKVQEWIDKAEHTDEEGELEEGYKYSAYADLFDAVDANQNAEGIIQTMVQNGGYDTDGLRGQIKDHLSERFIAGEITETALKNQLARYCKITKTEDANEIVKSAKCKRDFGVSPDNLKEAFKDGDLSQNQAEKALQQYKGLSKTDAQNRVQYWGYDGDLSENAWLKWNKDLKSSGLSVENWEKVYKVKNSAKGTDANGDGRADSGTVKAEVVSYIDSMNIPKSQKKAIYLAFGWAASTMPSWR